MKASFPDQTRAGNMADRRTGVRPPSPPPSSSAEGRNTNAASSFSPRPLRKRANSHLVSLRLQLLSLGLKTRQSREEKTTASFRARLIRKQGEEARNTSREMQLVRLTGLNLAATWFCTVHHSQRLLLTSEGKDFKVSSRRGPTSSTYCLLLFAAAAPATANRLGEITPPPP